MADVKKCDRCSAIYKGGAEETDMTVAECGHFKKQSRLCGSG